jgi:hypothetical protein
MRREMRKKKCCIISQFIHSSVLNGCLAFSQFLCLTSASIHNLFDSQDFYLENRKKNMIETVVFDCIHIITLKSLLDIDVCTMHKAKNCICAFWGEIFWKFNFCVNALIA